MNIKIYIEGGGNKNRGPLSKKLRNGFTNLFSKANIPTKNIHLIACGPKGNAQKEFIKACDKNSFCILLVDSDGPIPDGLSEFEYLKQGKNTKAWNIPSEHKDNCHLMVQAMEAWIISDIDAVKNYYGPKFDPSPISKRSDKENISTKNLEKILNQSIKNTPIKTYDKSLHSFDLIGMLSPATVRAKCPHCDRLFNTLEEKLGVS